MPIEIRELCIKAVIDSGSGAKKGGDTQAGEADAKPGTEGSAQAGEQVVDLCVEKVLEILRNKEER
jgi:hypothetical protein